MISTAGQRARMWRITWRSTRATSILLSLSKGRRLARAQDDRHRLAGRRLVDVDRQKAAAIVMSVEHGALLLAMRRVLGIVDVEQDAPRHRVEAVAEQGDHRRHHALQRGRA